MGTPTRNTRSSTWNSSEPMSGKPERIAGGCGLIQSGRRPTLQSQRGQPMTSYSSPKAVRSTTVTVAATCRKARLRSFSEKQPQDLTHVRYVIPLSSIHLRRRRAKPTPRLKLLQARSHQEIRYTLRERDRSTTVQDVDIYQKARFPWRWQTQPNDMVRALSAGRQQRKRVRHLHLHLRRAIRPTRDVAKPLRRRARSARIS